MKKVFIFLFYPLSVLYALLIEIRNFFYHSGLFRVTPAPIFSIGVGNITVGGTGKTPHIEYLIQHFESRHQIATLSRGYGRQSKGFLVLDSSLTPQQAGDEPWQFFLKYGHAIHVTVGEKRVPAAQKIHRLFPDVNLLLLDDVFQHRAIQPDFMVLLCDYNRPFFADYPFPAGRLREFRSGAKRADYIVVSKCPADMEATERTRFKERLAKYAPGVPVAFSSVTYGKVASVFSSVTVPARWLLVTGIAQPKPLVDYLQHQHCLVAHKAYPDHHEFTRDEAQEVVAAYHALKDTQTGVLITEKDYARLSPMVKELWKDLPLFYIPISVVFLEGESLLLENIQQSMTRRAGLSN